MKIAITGSNGLIGSCLCNKLQQLTKAEILSVPRELLYNDPQKLSSYIAGCDVIVHLSGAPVVSRWTKKRKRILWESRILTTQNLSKAIGLLSKKPGLFISTSAVGIYAPGAVHDESSNNFGEHSLGKLCREWEMAANQIGSYGIRTVIFRLGIVLSNKGGVLAKMLPFFRLGLGGRLGNGKQDFSFIHIDDLTQAYIHVIKNKSSLGAYNLVAPDLKTNGDFTKTLSKCLKRPAFLSIPSLLLKLILRKGAYVLLTGQRVVPARLINEGFTFKYLSLQSAVLSLLK